MPHWQSESGQEQAPTKATHAADEQVKVLCVVVEGAPVRGSHLLLVGEIDGRRIHVLDQQLGALLCEK